MALAGSAPSMCCDSKLCAAARYRNSPPLVIESAWRRPVPPWLGLDRGEKMPDSTENTVCGPASTGRRACRRAQKRCAAARGPFAPQTTDALTVRGAARHGVVCTPNNGCTPLVCSRERRGQDSMGELLAPAAKTRRATTSRLHQNAAMHVQAEGRFQKGEGPSMPARKARSLV